MKDTIFLTSNNGWGVTKHKNNWCACFGDKTEVALFLPYTTRYQAKKIARRLSNS
jgi:hypothetical protein